MLTRLHSIDAYLRIGLLCLIAGSSVCLTSCQSPGTDAKATLPSTAPLPVGTLPEDGSQQLLEHINQSRRQHKLPVLVVDPRLTRAALEHSESMLRHQYFDHRGHDGSRFQQRLLRNGYPRSHSAENIAMVHDPKLVFDMWFNSRGHYKNMMNPKYSRVGIGRAGNYWTANFAAPDGT
ncbi:CAP domain-containing protein [Verrucomicrobiaceae bacterium N1E253]|uniref:CAP domain-containing protein n=1 Tax=Oceaniferula marina TaxID=2748318 RepID=A0A851GDT5_9BACT|nr:CAP domain-containing protein [Oceaniferula marina]NWK55928.1 CAP domain-containing protein [Oceaniferula marina]